jgi:tetratricopeptide (TPR) repeat protein
MVERGALEKATQVLERALAVNSADADFLIEAVRLLRAQGHDDYAETFLNEAEERNVQAGRHGVVAAVRERLEPEAAAPAAPAPAPAATGGVPQIHGLSLDLDEDVYVLQIDDEAPAGPKGTVPREAVEDALGEIEVFVKYGFRDKALDRVGELLRSEPGNLRAHRLLIDLLLKDGSHRAVVEAANRMAAAAVASDALELWHETRDRLRGVGFLVAGDVVKAPPADLGEDTEEIDLLETGGPELEKAPRLDRPPGLDAAAGQARGDSAAADDLFDLVPAAAEPPIELGGAAPPAGQAVTPPFGIEQENVEFVVVDDVEFDDLAAEVEREMESAAAEPTAEAEAPSVEEIVASFKQGVAENLSPEDYDTHYNLGIAYREMGLTDEAIGEFEIAVKSRDYLIGCCSLLGLCFRDKGEFETATQWYTRGLGVPDIVEQERHALLYELGEAYETAGDLESARKAFAEISLTDDSYRDVGLRLAALS